MTRPDPQRAVEAIGGDRIGGQEPPRGEDRLHDLEPVRDPVDAADESPIVHVRVRRRGQPEGDLGLDAGLRQAGKRNVRAAGRQVADGAVVDIAPHRRVHVVFGPDGPVGEADLASDRPLAARLALRPDGGRDPIGVVQSEVGPASEKGATWRPVPGRRRPPWAISLEIHGPRRSSRALTTKGASGSAVGRFPPEATPKVWSVEGRTNVATPEATRQGGLSPGFFDRGLQPAVARASQIGHPPNAPASARRGRNSSPCVNPLTNDDGIHAAGLKLLESIAPELSDDVTVVAPRSTSPASRTRCRSATPSPAKD